MLTIISGANSNGAEDLRAHVYRSIVFALARFSDRIRMVRVRLGEGNNPQGHANQECRIHVRVKRLGSVFAVESDPNIHAAIVRATERVGQAVNGRLMHDNSQPTREAKPCPTH